MKCFIPLLLIFLSCQSNPTQKNSSKITPIETQIAKDLIQGAFDDLWGGVDSTKISKYHTDDFIILEQGEIWDNARIKQYMRSQLSNPERPKRINMMDYIAIDKYGESMQISYFNRADFLKNDSIVSKAKWLESAVAVKTEEGWKLKMMHSTWAGNK